MTNPLALWESGSVHESRECQLKVLLFALLQLKKCAKLPHYSQRIPVLPLLLKLSVTNAIDVNAGKADSPASGSDAHKLILVGAAY